MKDRGINKHGSPDCARRSVEKMELFVRYLLSSMRRAMVRPSASS